MSYQAPYIDESGYHYPSYQEILEDMVTSIQAIYGNDIYLGSDSMDYQMISLFALKVYDCYQAVELAYNSHSPVTAIGTALDYIVALNGITRTQASKSVAYLTLEGTGKTTITNGIVSDAAGILWDLPESVTIGDDGKVGNVKATCRNTGMIEAKANTITTIMTPTSGWISVTNEADATAGTVVESDSALRARQAVAVAAPSQSILAGLKAALLDVDNVSRVEVIENDTDENPGDEDSSAIIAAHSVCCIVDGSYTDDTEDAYDESIARTILNHKSMGCGTDGQHSVNITDTTGETYTIKYTRPEKVEIDVAASIKLIGTSSYSAEYYKTTIQTKVSEYVESYAIGKDFVPAMLYNVIQAINDDAANPQFYITSLTAKTGSGTASLDPITMAYYQYAYADASNVSVTVE